MAPYLVQINISSLPLPSTNTAEASISVVLTDTTGIAQPAVNLVGTETPPYSFTAQLTPSTAAGALTATALDTTGAAIGSALSGPFTILPAATFNSPTGFSVTPVTATAAAAAAHVAAARK